ncbi:MAG TPA: hypothetical protein VME23_22180, partial [Terracidiphilus sp.]|nr:hypothetical protein [Terracidiphilus sp.]
MISTRAVALAFLWVACSIQAQINSPVSPMTPDIPAKFTPPHHGYDFEKRVVMIPMRDGVKLYT